jgi:AcrR family transcriptional regulator
MVTRKIPRAALAGRSLDDRPTSGLGRPRSEAADIAILEAAVTLLDERGYGLITVDDIAARAGVGKQTIYRRWRSKAEVVLEAFTTWTAVEVATIDTGSVQEDVQALLRSAFAVLRSGRQKVVSSLMAEAQLSDEFAVAFREQFVARRRKVLTDVIRRGVERGQLGADIDVEFLADMIYGPMWYRLLNRHAPIDDSFADQLSAFVLARHILAPHRKCTSSPNKTMDG